MTAQGGAYEQSQRFLDASPRPKLRKQRAPKPGQRKAPAAFVHVTEDTERGLALIRGKGVGRILELAVVTDVASWSVSGKGHVIPSDRLADVLAMAQYVGALVTITTIGEPS